MLATASRDSRTNDPRRKAESSGPEARLHPPFAASKPLSARDFNGEPLPGVKSPVHQPRSLAAMQANFGNQAVLRLLGRSNHIHRKCAACESGQSSCPACSGSEDRVRMPPFPGNSSLVRRELRDAGESTEAGTATTTPEGIGVDGGMESGRASPTGKQAGERRSPRCPTQTVTMSRPVCGSDYGAVGRYCYSGANRWWFKERVTMGSGNTCVPGATINQRTTPFQASANCVLDDISNHNGPPSAVAPCRIVTNQTVFTGPTRATVEQCQYSNTQVIEVTRTGATGGTVTTSSAGVSTHCDWT